MLTLLLICGVLLGVSQAASIGTCTTQKNCIRMVFAEEPVNRPIPGTSTVGPCTTGDCQWQACLILDYGSGCVKDTKDSISHTCKKSNAVCGGGDFRDSTTIQVTSNVGEGYQQCQTGAPGSKLYFLLKDGKGCDADGGKTASIAYDGYRITTTGASMSCSPTASDSQSCTGNPTGMECIWEVTLPNYCKAYATTTTITGATEGSSAGGSTTGGSSTDDKTSGSTTPVDTKCSKTKPCQNGGSCSKTNNGDCTCREGYSGYFCEQLSCSNVLTNYPDYKILDGGKGPSCTLDQAKAALGADKFDCHPVTEGCDILKCATPIPPENIDNVRRSCPDTLV